MHIQRRVREGSRTAPRAAPRSGASAVAGALLVAALALGSAGCSVVGVRRLPSGPTGALAEDDGGRPSPLADLIADLIVASGVVRGRPPPTPAPPPWTSPEPGP